MVLSVRRTFRPRWRKQVKACGEVTSWTRCKSTYSTAGQPGSCATTWLSHIFSKRVRGGKFIGWFKADPIRMGMCADHGMAHTMLVKNSPQTSILTQGPGFSAYGGPYQHRPGSTHWDINADKKMDRSLSAWGTGGVYWWLPWYLSFLSEPSFLKNEGG